MNINEFRQRRAEIRQAQLTDPINLWITAFQKKNKRSPSFKKDTDPAGNWHIVKYKSIDGVTYVGDGESLTIARRKLCNELLLKKIDI